MRSVILVFIAANVATALNCYQGIQNASQKLTTSSTSCPTLSLSCIKVYDSSTNTVTRSCQNTNCSLNGAVSSTGFCQNTTSYPYQTYCCCYNDGCNSAQSYSSLVLRFGWFSIPVLGIVTYSAK